MAGFGVSFVPGGGSADPQQAQPGGPAAGAPPVQRAVQMLSLRLPRVVGANGMAPGPLLNAPGAMGQPGAGLNGAANNPLLMALLQLAGMGGNGMGGNGQPGMGGMPSAGPSFGSGGSPTRITPGGGPPAPQPGLGVPTFPGAGDWSGGPPDRQPAVDRTNPGLGNRGTDAPLLSGGPAGSAPFGGQEDPGAVFNRLLRYHA